MTDPSTPDLLAGKDITYFDLSALKIAPLRGLLRLLDPHAGASVSYATMPPASIPALPEATGYYTSAALRYGGYDTVMKTMLERAIPVQQAFIRIHEGETHHVQRAVALKQATILAYGAQTEEEQDIFRQPGGPQRTQHEL